MALCPKCSREWPDGCEQHQAITMFGECVVCRFGPGGVGTPEELEKIGAPETAKLMREFATEETQ